MGAYVQTTNRVNWGQTCFATGNMGNEDFDLGEQSNLFQRKGNKIPLIREVSEYLDTVDFRYLEVQGTLLNTSRYPYIDISDLQN